MSAFDGRLHHGPVAFTHTKECKGPDRCTCSYKDKLREFLAVPGLLASKEWKGSTAKPVEYNGRQATKLTHPSGAIAYLYIL